MYRSIIYIYIYTYIGMTKHTHYIYSTIHGTEHRYPLSSSIIICMYDLLAMLFFSKDLHPYRTSLLTASCFSKDFVNLTSWLRFCSRKMLIHRTSLLAVSWFSKDCIHLTSLLAAFSSKIFIHRTSLHDLLAASLLCKILVYLTSLFLAALFSKDCIHLVFSKEADPQAPYDYRHEGRECHDKSA